MIGVDHIDFDLLDPGAVFASVTCCSEQSFQDKKYCFHLGSLGIFLIIEQQSHMLSVLTGETIPFPVYEGDKRTGVEGIVE